MRAKSRKAIISIARKGDAGAHAASARGEPDDEVQARHNKCARTVCRRTSANRQQDGWIWVEFKNELKTGWWCPPCLEAPLQELMTDLGVEDHTERLQ
jgi:hypothetical protein